MLVIDCPVHSRQVLVPPTRIRSLANTATGILVVVQCWCGALVRLRTGRRAVADPDGPTTGAAGRRVRPPSPVR